MMKRWLAVLPLLAFAALAMLLALSLRSSRPAAASLVGQRLPAFRLSALAAGQPALRPESLRGRVWLLNLWASWCEPCRHEHAFLLQLARSQPVAIVGIAQHDAPDAARAWLEQAGNPYAAIALDPTGQAALALRASGVPTTYLVDAQGIVRWQHTGPLGADIVHAELEPLLRKIKEASDS